MKKLRFSIPQVALSLFGATLALLTLAPRPAFAWGMVGHKVIARIAWDDLKPETRAKLIAILNAAPADSDIASLRPANLTGADADRALFEMAASWPDMVRSQKTDHEKARRATYHHGNWHYDDHYFEQNETTGKITERTDKPAEKENAVERLTFLTSRFTDTTTPAGERAVDLAWIEHLTGDLTMPLHNVGRITPQEPDGDQGGNLFKLGTRPGSNRPDNLHSYWDDLPENNYPIASGETDEAWLGRIATAATQVLPLSLFEEAGMLELGRYEEWSLEGAEVAHTRVYTPDLKRSQTPAGAYAQEAKQTMLVGLAKAGHRLAATLEAALASKS